MLKQHSYTTRHKQYAKASTGNKTRECPLQYHFPDYNRHYSTSNLKLMWAKQHLVFQGSIYKFHPLEDLQWGKASMLREALWLAKHREGWTTSPCFPPYRSPKTVREGGRWKSGKTKKTSSPVEDQEIHCWVGSGASFRPRSEKIFATNPFW